MDTFLKIGYHFEDGSKAKCFYVYVHKDPVGNVFYVGKGRDKRAWETTRRHILWERYIERFNGKYHVEIIKEGLIEDKALI